MTHVYWACDEAEKFKGYRPRTVRLHVDLTVTEPHDVASVIVTVEEICNREQQAMLAWADGSVSDRERLAPKYDGTVRSLIELYRSDKESSFQRLKENTQDSYAEWLDVVEKTIGLRRLDRMQPKWLRTCYDEWGAPEKEGDAPRTRRAYGCIQMMKVLLNYGVEGGIPHAARLRDGMEKMRFEKNPPTRRDNDPHSIIGLCRPLS
jgi:hypothetical protein